tara:strand:+ start:662 stop:787 length:126 start_codon:yes stop_codon:yes gene_type:complete
MMADAARFLERFMETPADGLLDNVRNVFGSVGETHSAQRRL